MLPSLMITFRETLEAALVVGVILSFLSRTGRQSYNRWVYGGILVGIGASLVGAGLFHWLAGGFEGRAEQLFEGLTMLIGAGLLTTMIVWMIRHKPSTLDIENVALRHLESTQGVGLFLLVFFAVLREGVETVVFLNAARYMSGEQVLMGGIFGVILALGVGVAFFYGTLKIRLALFFQVTTALLILFAAGLVAYGVHELQEARVIPILVEHVWDINPVVQNEGSFPMLHEKGAVGGIFKGLFGYNGNPSLIEVLSWLAYLALAILTWGWVKRPNPVKTTEARESA